MAHPIRLRGPWQCELVQEADARTQTVQMPANWADFLPSEHAGSVALTRRFGQPAGLTSADRVYLVIVLDTAGGAGPESVWLNEARLALTLSATEMRCDLTELLNPRNGLRMEFAAAAAGVPRQGRPPEVWLEIVEGSSAGERLV